ncbi:MAG: hypothetical protein A3G09_04470 [Candidatus Moranbacteria bacterium RIFCSPLOWO2_12_FULL_48_12]|nr:MAG: hypothetical protein A3G09_04470 [Candidatus Moranbacteria bacterium RIFCSPLOWO2_12_FULL_48_12]
MELNLLDLVSLPLSYQRQWQETINKGLAKISPDALSEDIADEDARVDADGSLVIFGQCGSQKLEMRVPVGEWFISPFGALAEPVALWVISMIAEKTPRDRKSEGKDWQGKLFGVIDTKGYISPDGKVFRFMYNGEGPFQSVSRAAAFGFALGDAAPDWAKGK